MNKNSSIIIILIVSLIVLVTAGFAIFNMYSKTSKEEDIIIIPKIKSPLKNNYEKHLHIVVAIQGSSKKKSLEIKQRITVIQSILNNFISQIRYQDNIQGESLVNYLSEEIKKRINVVCKESVEKVFIKEISVE